jgi:hypothetical protein
MNQTKNQLEEAGFFMGLCFYVFYRFNVKCDLKVLGFPVVGSINSTLNQ